MSVGFNNSNLNAGSVTMTGTGGAVQSSTTNADTMLFNVWRTTSSAYKTMMTFTVGATPSLAISKPLDTALTIDGATITTAVITAPGITSPTIDTWSFAVGGAFSTTGPFTATGTNSIQNLSWTQATTTTTGATPSNIISITVNPSAFLGLEITLVGIKSDYSESIFGKFITAARRGAAGAPVLVASASNPMSIALNDNLNATVSTSISTNNLVVTVTGPAAGSPTYNWKAQYITLTQ